MVDSEFCGTITGLDLTQCAVLCAFFFSPPLWQRDVFCRQKNDIKFAFF